MTAAGEGGREDDGGRAGRDAGGAGGISGEPTQAGAAGEGGGSDGGSTGEAQELPFLLGPETDDAEPILLDDSHANPCPVALGVGSLHTDASGNIYTVDANGISKIDSGFECTPIPNTRDGGSLIAVTSNGDFVVAGRGGSVIKYDEDGEVAWSDTWKSSGSETTLSVVIASDGSIFTAGNSTGQAPGNPATAAGGRWMAKYTPTGNREWIKQTGGETASALVLGAGDELFARSSRASEQLFQRFDTDGNLTFETSAVVGPVRVIEQASYDPADPTTFYTSSRAFERPLAASDGKSLYVWDDSGVASTTSPILMKIERDGTLDWYRSGEPRRSKVLDEVEGATWSGYWGFLSTGTDWDFAVGDDAVYLMGHYLNVYEHGSNPKPDLLTTFVGRYDLTGERVWFRQFAGSNAGVPTELSGLGRNVVLAADGNLVVSMGSGPNYLFRLNAETGDIVE